MSRPVGRPRLVLHGRQQDRLHLIVLQRMKQKGVACAKEKAFSGKKVYIWSAEHCCYWRPGGHGYTRTCDDAGVWTYEVARAGTWHCGPEKKIVFEKVR